MRSKKKNDKESTLCEKSSRERRQERGGVRGREERRRIS
jgi:hypothetical protein